MPNTDEVVRPSKVIKQEMAKRDLTQKDIAVITGRSSGTISDYLAKEKITIQFAKELSLILGRDAGYWLSLGNRFELAFDGEISSDVARRNELIQNYPLRILKGRGWVSNTDEVDDLIPEVDRLIEQKQKIMAPPNFKRTLENADLNWAERYWLGRAIELAMMLPIDNRYDATRLESLFALLKKVRKSSRAVHKVAELLQRYGIRFVVLQKIPRAMVDGAAFWLDKESPVIALSIRNDNIGSFWFALMHELFHIKNRDSFSFDNLDEESTNDIEQRANREAANFLVPQELLKDFIFRTRPYYSRAKINDFATRLKVHPGIIVGQLQKREEIGYNTHHDSMVSVRELVTTTAFSDGWEQPVPQN